MADVLLHDAVGQVRAHLRAGRYSDAFALARHILHFYPKHIETYTVLAQVSLATNDLAGANDLLRRVLSADPENIVALSGMGLISETQDKYDEALWYLERAYEIQPSNDELRTELLRIREMYYGTAPARVELTPGALARVYARQGQYAQAVNEFRRLLRNDSKRYDARVGLAEALYRAGRTDEAAQVAQGVMEDAPYALKPNLILGALWTENAVPEGQVYLQRAHQLDPEHRVARDLLGEQFDGTQAPRLPTIGEAVPQPAAASVEPEPFDIFGTENETARAVQTLTEIEREQESAGNIQEPLLADTNEIDRVETQQQAPAADESQFEAPADVSAAPETAGIAADISAPEAVQASAPQAEPPRTALEEILAAEREQAIREKAAPASPQPVPAVKSPERSARKSGEGLSADTIAAAAAALASSIALDKSSQPSPARRAHPALPKVRPVIRSAQDKLPGWLRLSATPANAPASFDAPDSTGAAQPATGSERPDWLVQAEAVSAAESVPSRQDTAMPDWLNAPPESARPPVRKQPAHDVPAWLRDEPHDETTPIAQPLPGETREPKAPEVPEWLRDKSAGTPADTVNAMPTEPVQPRPSVVALPDWLREEKEAATETAPEETAPIAEGWTNVPEAKTPDEPVWQNALDREPLPVRAQAQSETPVASASETDVESPNPEGDIPEKTAQEASAHLEPAAESAPSAQASVPETSAPAEAAPAVEERAPIQAMPDSATMLQMARDKRDSGDLKGALDLYERVMHRRPNHLEQVTADLQAIIGAGGAPTSANRLLGEAYAMVGRFKESLEQYRIAMGK